MAAIRSGPASVQRLADGHSRGGFRETSEPGAMDKHLRPAQPKPSLNWLSKARIEWSAFTLCLPLGLQSLDCLLFCSQAL
eukprot:12497959-Prorocentrum_lima.AAC.1